MRCQKCSNDVSAATGYCPMCGEALPKGSYSSSSQQQSKNSSSSKGPSGLGNLKFSSNTSRNASAQSRSQQSSYGMSRNTPRHTSGTSSYSTTHSSEPSSSPDLSSYYASLPRHSYVSTPTVPTVNSVPSPTPTAYSTVRPKAAKTPLSTVGLLLTAILTSILVVYNLSEIFSYGSSFPYLRVVSDIAPLSGIYSSLLNFLKTLSFLLELPNIAAAIAMWLMFGAMCSSAFKSGMFCAGITLLKGFRIFILVLWCILLGLFALSLSTITELSPSERGTFLKGYLVILTVLIMVIVYHSSVIHTLNTIRDGAVRGIYYKASGYVIFCLFASAVVSLICIAGLSALPSVSSYVDTSFLSSVRGIVLPIVHGVCLCIYNTKRHEFNSLK